MNSTFIETLESRCLFSSMLDVTAEPALPKAPASIHEFARAERRRYPDLKGTWNGWRSLAFDTLALTLNVTRQSGNTFSGKIISPDDHQIRVNISGQFISRSKLQFKLTGRDFTGALSGNGSGKVNSAANRLGGRMVFTNSIGTFPGTFRFRR